MSKADESMPLIEKPSEMATFHLALEKEFAERFNMPVRYNLTNTRGFSLEIVGEFKGTLPPNVISVSKRAKSTFITTLQLAHLSDRFELLYNDICLLTDQ